MTKRLTTLLVFALLIPFLAYGCGGDDDEDGDLAEAETLTIGYAASQTGRLAIFEEPLLKGIEAQIAAINDQGGIDGEVEIELEVRDCASDPERCGVVAQELIDDGAQVLISPCDVDASLPAATLAQRDEVPIFSSCGSGSSFREQIGEYAFLNVYGTIAEGQAMAEFAEERGWETAAMMTSGDIEYTESIIEAATERFQELDGEVATTETFTLDAPSYATQATSLAGTNPDVVMTSMFLPASNTFLRNLRAAGYDGPVIGPDGMSGDETFAAGAAAEDVFVATFAHPEGAPENATEEFRELYVEHHGEEPDLVMSSLGADLAIIIEAAVSEAGSVDPVEIQDALDELEGVLGATSEITYAGRGGVPAKDVLFLETNVAEEEFELVARFVPEAVEE